MAGRSWSPSHPLVSDLAFSPWCWPTFCPLTQHSQEGINSLAKSTTGHTGRHVGILAAAYYCRRLDAPESGPLFDRIQLGGASRVAPLLSGVALLPLCGTSQRDEPDATLLSRSGNGPTSDARHSGSTTSINREPVDRLWHASLQMLSEAEKHFVVCKSHDPPDEKQLANQLILRVHQATPSRWIDDEAAFVDRYVPMSESWSTDFHSLELCMASHRATHRGGQTDESVFSMLARSQFFSHSHYSWEIVRFLRCAVDS